MNKFLRSLNHAIEGLLVGFKEQPNLRIHFILGTLASLLGVIFQISASEWLILVVVIGIVIAVELTNTAVESVVNLHTREFHPEAKKAKDICAGAVLVSAIMAVIVGLIIFLPRLLTLLTVR